MNLLDRSKEPRKGRRGIFSFSSFSQMKSGGKDGVVNGSETASDGKKEVLCAGHFQIFLPDLRTTRGPYLSVKAF